MPADRVRRFQVFARQRTAVPTIALHAVALPGNQRAADRMVGAALAPDESVRVGVHRQAEPGAGRGAVGVTDPRIGLPAGVFAGQRQVHGGVGVQRPWVPAVQLGKVARHQLRIGQAGGGVVFGVAGNGAGLRNGGLQAGFLQVGGARTALALAEVHRDRNTAVARGLDRFHLAQPHVHVQTAFFAAAHFGLGRAGGAGALEQPLRDVGECLQALQAVVGHTGFGGECVQCFILWMRIRPRKPGHRGRTV